MVRKGYKQTEIGVIPEDWQPYRVGDLVTFSGGSQPPHSTFIFKPRVGYVRLIQIRDYKTDSYATYIPEALVKKSCTSDDVMIGRYGPPIFQILRGLEGAYNVALIKAIPSEAIDKEFLFHFMRNNKLFNLMEMLSQRSSGQTGVEIPALKEYPLALPSKKEQRLISQALSDADALIAALDRLIAKKKGVRIATAQQLLTGEMRLPGFVESWKERKIEDIAEPVVEKNVHKESLPVLTCSKHLGFVDSLSYFKNQVFSKDTRGYKIIYRNQIGYPANHIEEGSIGLQNLYNKALVSPIYIVFSVNQEIDSYFLHRTLKLDSYRQKFKTATTSSVDRRGSLRWREFSQITVLLPNFSEQQAISTVLSDMDSEIAALEARLAKAQAIKQGMMQELLTGRTRLI